jgi:hyperosmotically inducible periplasmic protein
MNGSSLKLLWLALLCGSFVHGGLLMAMPIPSQDNPQTAPDNTKNNQDHGGPTADQQKTNPADRAITQKIRKAIHEDQSLSTYAHNIKVITQDGRVTLRGPVRSEEEKSNLEAKAVSVAGQDNITDELEVMPSQ